MLANKIPPLPIRGRCAETWSRDRRNVEQGPACGMRPWSRSMARRSNADPMRVSRVRSPKGPLFRLSTRPGFRGCDRGGARKHAGHCGTASRSGVASKHRTLGTCSALRGREVGVKALARVLSVPPPSQPSPVKGEGALFTSPVEGEGALLIANGHLNQSSTLSLCSSSMPVRAA